MTEALNARLCFIGGGNMAAALIAGLRRQSPAPAVHVVDLAPDILQDLAQRYGVSTASSLDQQVSQAEVIVLAVKPQQMQAVAASLQPHLSAAQLVVSVAAGIRAADLSRWLGGHAAVVRAMPNTPALVGQGMTGMLALPAVSPAQRALADQVLRTVGATLWLEDEALLDSLTAVSGSGPAYVFYVIEAMQQAAMELGLSPEQAQILSLATVAGAAQLAVQSPETVTTLRQRVTSPGGTTHAAITAMEAAGLAQAIARGMQAAAQRSRELGEEFGQNQT